MREHPFIFLSGVDGKNNPVATQVPVFIDENDGRYFLTGHIMRNSDHHRAFIENSSVLAVFTGPHVYVSATWYDNPHQASTWNYMSVHAKGKIRFSDEEELVKILKRLSLHYENNNTGSTTVFDNLSSEYTNPLVKAIVAFEIEISTIENVFKLSQNRNKKSYENIIHELNKQEGDGKKIAEEMSKRLNELFDQ